MLPKWKCGNVIYKNKYFLQKKMDFSEPLLSIQNGIQAG
jgi:hypothetical protein